MERARALVDLAPEDPDRSLHARPRAIGTDVEDAIATFRRVLTHCAATYARALQPRAGPEADGSVTARRSKNWSAALAIEPRPEGTTPAASSTGTGVISIERRRRSVTRSRRRRFRGSARGAGIGAEGETRLAGAAAALRRAIVLSLNDPAPHFTLAQVQRSAGDERGAAPSSRARISSGSVSRATRKPRCGRQRGRRSWIAATWRGRSTFSPGECRQRRLRPGTLSDGPDAPGPRAGRGGSAGIRPRRSTQPQPGHTARARITLTATMRPCDSALRNAQRCLTLVRCRSVAV